ncbi:hypothetical protein FO519_007745 [Halicephalobus sp. NKZ332]|nr:hypothetical protein FO519_007745 [Halicephalobus sp. NKZ332]
MIIVLGARIAEDPNFPAELKGIAIGNGFMHAKMLLNSLVLWSNYHGRLSLDNWKALKSPECCKTSPDADKCDWTPYMVSDNRMDYVGDNSTCGKILSLVLDDPDPYDYDPYNYYESCYTGSEIDKLRKRRRTFKRKTRKQSNRSYVHNTADTMNRDSTDPFWGYPCYQETYVTGYLNRPEVQDAFHIDPDWRKGGMAFADCSDDIYDQYIMTYNDTSPFFQTMIDKDYSVEDYTTHFSLLLFLQIDTLCDFIGDSKFIDTVASSNNFGKNERKRWRFRNQLAGFYQRYFSQDKNFTIDVLTQIDFDSGDCLMMMAGPFRLSPNPVTFHLINLYIFGLFFCVAVLPVPFIFRYFAVCRNMILSKTQYTFLLLTAFFASFLYTCVHAWAFWPRTDLTRYNHIIDYDFWKDSQGNSPVFVAASVKDGRLIILVTLTMLMGTISYALVIFFNMIIYRKLANIKKRMSNRTFEGQKQLGLVLKYQALVPFVICVIPLTLGKMNDEGFWMPLQTIHQVSGWTSGGLSLCLNVFLLLMILTKTTGELKNYSRILIQGCIVDMGFTIQIDFDSGDCLMMMAGPFRLLPNPVTFHLINLYIFGLFCCVAVLPIPFIFRYFAVCRNRILTCLQYSSLVLVSVFASVCYTCLHAWAFWPRDNLDTFTHIINYNFWKDSRGNLPVFVAASIALVPFVICVVPLTLVFILCALGTKTTGKGIILTMLVSWIPVMNPLSTILFVRQYRRFFTTSLIARILCPGRSMMEMTRINNDVTTMAPAKKITLGSGSHPRPNTISST